ncbi:MAG: cobP [Hyphomicrobiales bacterium]|nr:cobP [Hyphomicrobiales bacterium]
MTDIVRTALILGGARSGKSGFAQGLAENSGRKPVLIATAQALDDEMAARIAHHRADRGSVWGVLEEPLDLVGALAREAINDNITVVDCLTLWIGNLMCAELEVALECERLIEAVTLVRAPVIFVSNEVGSGIVPDNAMARTFRDYQGRLNQRLAQACDHVVLVVAGCPLQVKPATRVDLQF